ncbi:hypothetical protein GMO_16340 [Gluconobacter morbifer G707]|uniref:Uncharacterized protein n=1 Tax=Gluconobacter morbifer G707 TaxID=1088869 RepID=G6XJQ5_9PROT|nr:hypothetical protein GMO_16340 [Gluconobacter morbifer G707]
MCHAFPFLKGRFIDLCCCCEMAGWSNCLLPGDSLCLLTPRNQRVVHARHDTNMA